MIFKVQSLEVSDYPMITGWWQSAGMKAPELEMIPLESSFLISGEKPVLSVSLIKTNTIVLWIDNLISNPEVEAKLRREAVDQTMEWIKDWAKKLGFKRLLCMSIEEKTKRRYEQLGFVPTAHHVVSMTQEL